MSDSGVHKKSEQGFFFPDPIFRAYLKSIKPAAFTGDYLTDEVILDEVETIDATNKGIHNITGIEKYPALRRVLLGRNKIKEADFSNSPDILELEIYDNLLTELNLRDNISLVTLDATLNFDLKTLDISGMRHPQSRLSISNPEISLLKINEALREHPAVKALRAMRGAAMKTEIYNDRHERLILENPVVPELPGVISYPTKISGRVLEHFLWQPAESKAKDAIGEPVPTYYDVDVAPAGYWSDKKNQGEWVSVWRHIVDTDVTLDLRDTRKYKDYPGSYYWMARVRSVNTYGHSAWRRSRADIGGNMKII